MKELFKTLGFIETLVEINRQETYFSLIGVLISIVIFSASILTSERKGIEKRMIADLLPISKTVYLSIALVITFWIEPTIVESKTFCSYFVLLMEIVINIFIIYSYVLTFRLMRETMRLTSDDIYYSNKLKEYIDNQTRKIEEEFEKTNKTYKIDNNSFIKKLSKTNCSLYEYGSFMFKDEYVSLIANFDGLVIDVNKSGLPKTKLNKKETGHDSILYIDNVIGKYISKGDPVCYCNKEYKEEYKDTRKFFKINENYSPYNRKFEEILDCLFSKAVIANGDFDKDNIIRQYVVFLYNNKCNTAIDLLISEIIDYFYEIRDKEVNLNNYYYFIRSIREYALRYDDFTSYCKLDDLIVSYYYTYLNTNDIEDRADSIKTSLSMQLYELKSKNSNYYDYSLSNFLKLIYYQIRNKKYGIVKDLIKENYTIFDRYEIKNENIHIINLSFICGLIKGLLTKLKESASSKNEEIIAIKEILDYIGEEEDCLDGVEIVERFKKMKAIAGSTYRVCNNCEMYIEKHKNGAIFSVNDIDDVELLVKVLNVFGSCLFMNQKYEQIDYKKEDKYFFEQFEKEIKKEQKENEIIKNILDYNKVKDYLNYAISKCKKDENEYIISERIEKSFFIDFESKIRKEVYKLEDLLEILNQKSKIKYDKANFDNKLSLSYYLPRELFINYDSYKSILMDPFRNTFGLAISERYCTYINNNFSTYNSIEELNEIISIDDDYLILVNESLCFDKYIDRFTTNKKLVINGKEFDCYLNSDEIVGIKAIKVCDLPSIYIDSRCSINDQTHVVNGIYIKTFDLANDATKRNEILEHNKEINEDSLLTKVLFNAMMNVKIDR